MQASKAFWNRITSATFIILKVWSKLQLVTSLERALSQEHLLNTSLVKLWGFSCFPAQRQDVYCQVGQEWSIHHLFIFFSWIRSPQGTTTQDEGRLPLIAISKYKLSSLGLLHEINSSFPSQHHHPCYHQYSRSFLQHKYPSHRLSPFPKYVGSQGRRQPQTLCLTAPSNTMPSCPGASPSSELLSKRESLI